MPLEGTLSGRVLRTQQAELVSADDSVQVVVPVTDRGDALGAGAGAPRGTDTQMMADIAAAGHALA